MFGCVYLWAEGREGTDLSQGTQMGARDEQQLFPSRDGHLGHPGFVWRHLRLWQGSFPPGMGQTGLSKTPARAQLPSASFPSAPQGSSSWSSESCPLPAASGSAPSFLSCACSCWESHSWVPRDSGSPSLPFPSPWCMGSRALTSSSSDLLPQIGPVLGRTCQDLPPPPQAFEGSHVGSCTLQTLVGKSHKPSESPGSSP